MQQNQDNKRPIMDRIADESFLGLILYILVCAGCGVAVLINMDMNGVTFSALFGEAGDERNLVILTIAILVLCLAVIIYLIRVIVRKREIMEQQRIEEQKRNSRKKR